MRPLILQDMWLSFNHFNNNPITVQIKYRNDPDIYDALNSIRTGKHDAEQYGNANIVVVIGKHFYFDKYLLNYKVEPFKYNISHLKQWVKQHMY